ncbi:cysteine--tRNA ligase [Candidatus Riesia sp. GBBU]|nr:cysteine--tRNA ligase [Candidatus Riesia sp. GBBU]
MIYIYNTLNKKKEKFKTIQKKLVKMYVCGITMYDVCHIGHGRTFVVFDMINRYLRYSGYDLIYVRNITDINDKIIKISLKKNTEFTNIVLKMQDKMNQDLKLLKVLKPNFEPKVTNHIDEIIDLIKVLIKNGNAYISKCGDVMFSVNSDPNYGILSKQNLEKLCNKNSFYSLKNKRNNLDFVLWKITKKKNEPKWLSPWGYGRPGWHIECSAMSTKILGNYFDIHGGGMDLIFPHHENEISQSICANKSSYAKYWIHVGMVRIKCKKMSKSLKNFITIKEILRKYNPEVIRYFFLSKHYRKSVNYNEKYLIQSKSSLERLYSCIDGIKCVKTEKTDFRKKFFDAMNDDFNTPKAFSILFDIVRKINIIKNYDKRKVGKLAFELKYLANILGIMHENPKNILQYNKKIKNGKSKFIELMIEQRKKARIKKQWEKADDIRNKLKLMGIILEDIKDNTTWKEL